MIRTTRAVVISASMGNSGIPLPDPWVVVTEEMAVVILPVFDVEVTFEEPGNPSELSAAESVKLSDAAPR